MLIIDNLQIIVSHIDHFCGNCSPWISPEGNHTMALGAGTISTSEGQSWTSVVDAVDISLIHLGVLGSGPCYRRAVSGEETQNMKGRHGNKIILAQTILFLVIGFGGFA